MTGAGHFLPQTLPARACFRSAAHLIAVVSATRQHPHFVPKRPSATISRQSCISEIGAMLAPYRQGSARRSRVRQYRHMTFLCNHMEGIASIDLFVVPTIAFQQLFAFLVLGHRRRQLLWFAVTRTEKTISWTPFVTALPSRLEITKAFKARARPTSWAPTYEAAGAPAAIRSIGLAFVVSSHR